MIYDLENARGIYVFRSIEFKFLVAFISTITTTAKTNNRKKLVSVGKVGIFFLPFAIYLERK